MTIATTVWPPHGFHPQLYATPKLYESVHQKHWFFWNIPIDSLTLYGMHVYPTTSYYCFPPLQVSSGVLSEDNMQGNICARLASHACSFFLWIHWFACANKLTALSRAGYLQLRYGNIADPRPCTKSALLSTMGTFSKSIYLAYSFMSQAHHDNMFQWFNLMVVTSHL